MLIDDIKNIFLILTGIIIYYLYMDIKVNDRNNFVSYEENINLNFYLNFLFYK